ncbi:MAG: ABC transporter substrate-binding protein, partial [Chloroflexota bacterium]|nr:ABC transporter substrate-binding protein [Chloroflexota bacterium]
VKASFERIVWPPKGVVSQRQLYFDAVAKIETPDDYTVKFTLSRPQASFPAIVSVPFNGIFPKALLDKKPDMKKDIMGSGPFRFKEYIRGVQFVVEKNPDYFIPGRPYLDGVVRYIIPDPAAAKGAFISGRLDLLHLNLPYTEAELGEMKKQVPGMVVPKAVGFALFAFIPNVTRKPWNDLRVRRAVMLALDKDALLEHHKPGQGVRGGYMPPGPWAIPNEDLLKLPGWGKTTAKDLVEAKQLLAEAGYPKGFTASHAARNIREYVDQGVSFQGMLAKVGITLELDIMENAAWQVIRRTPNFETMGSGAVSVEMGEPDIILSRYLSGSTGNYSQYKNPRIDELYREQSQAMDPAERVKKVLEVQRIMIEDLPFMPWAWQGYEAIHSARVKNYSLPG